MSETMQTTLAEFEKGDEITFNDRVQPLTVTRVHEFSSSGSTWVYVEGPRGGEYRLAAYESERRDDVVERDVSSYGDPEWQKVETLDGVELVTPAAEVEPPVEVGDEFKDECTLDCVSYTGEFDGYRVVDVDRESQTITLAIVAYAESKDPDVWADQIPVHYQDLADRKSRGLEEVDDLRADDDVTLNNLAALTGRDDRDDGDDEPELVTDGGVELVEVDPNAPLYEQVEEGDTVTISYTSKSAKTRQERTGTVTYVTDESSNLSASSVKIEVEGYSYDAVRARTMDYSTRWSSVGTSTEASTGRATSVVRLRFTFTATSRRTAASRSSTTSNKSSTMASTATAVARATDTRSGRIGGTTRVTSRCTTAMAMSRTFRARTSSGTSRRRKSPSSTLRRSRTTATTSRNSTR